jgi:hypothetical protein
MADLEGAGNMSSQSPFDHRRDAELGAMLLEVLTPTDDAVFVRGVLGRVGAAPTWWEVLDGWARPGLAAALVLVALAGFLLGRTLRSEPALALDEPVRAVAEGIGAAALFSAAVPPDVDMVVLAVSNEQ